MFFSHLLNMLAHVLWWSVLCEFITLVTMMHYKMLGPSDFEFKSMKDCDDFKSVVKFGISQKKYNRTTNVLHITVESADYEIGDNLVVELKGSLKKDGGFKPGAYYMKATVCKLIGAVVGDIADDVFKAFGIEGCPIPPGSYEAVEYYFDNDKFTVPQLFGDYKMEMNVYKDRVLLGCFIAYYNLLDKKA